MAKHIDEDEWKEDFNEFDNEKDDEFPSELTSKNKNEDDNDNTSPHLEKQSTIYVTQQLRYFEQIYTIVGPIGEPGQFGMAFECYEKLDKYKRRRCVKEINKARFHHIDSHARDDILRTMQNEIHTLKQVDHDNIVKLFDVFEDRHKLHLVMEFLPGGELFDRIASDDGFSEKKAAKILKQILSALDHMHDKNILHLDLKPDNILFASKDENSEIKLIDFGMARAVPRLAKLKDRVGTPNYMAPEVFEGSYSKAADVWSVGVILFCMLFGFPPFHIDEDNMIMDEHKVLEEKIKKGFIFEVRDGYGPWFPKDIPVSDNCKHLLTMMLQKNVKTRWTVKECLSSLWIQGNAPDNKVSPIVSKALQKFQATSKFKVAVSNLFTTRLDTDHVQTVKEFFKKLDKDGDGKLTLIEFKEGMKSKFDNDENISDEQLEKMFNNVDIDGNKTITIDELITICAHRALIDEDERLFELFRELDKNGDGLLTMEEIESAMSGFNKNKNRKPQSKKVMERIKTAFKIADINNDGTIDYEEFLRMIHPDFESGQTFDDFKMGHIENRYRGASFNIRMATMDKDAYEDLKPEEIFKRQKQKIKERSQRRLLNWEKKKKSRHQASTTSLDNIMGLGSLFDNNKIKISKSTANLIPEDKSVNINFRAKSSSQAEQIVEIKKLKNNVENQKTEISKLTKELSFKDETIDELKKKIDKLKKDKIDISEKYQQDLRNLIKDQKNDENKSNNDKSLTQFKILSQQIIDKDKKLDKKDETILNLTKYLNEKDKAIKILSDENSKSKKTIKGLEKLLQDAVDSKMRSLTQMQSEIQKLRIMLNKNSGKKKFGKKNNNNNINENNANNNNNNNNSNKTQQNQQNGKLGVLKKQHTRHLSFGLFGY